MDIQSLSKQLSQSQSAVASGTTSVTRTSNEPLVAFRSEHLPGDVLLSDTGTAETSASAQSSIIGAVETAAIHDFEFEARDKCLSESEPKAMDILSRVLRVALKHVHVDDSVRVAMHILLRRLTSFGLRYEVNTRFDQLQLDCCHFKVHFADCESKPERGALKDVLAFPELMSAEELTAYNRHMRSVYDSHASIKPILAFKPVSEPPSVFEIDENGAIVGMRADNCPGIEATLQMPAAIKARCYSKHLDEETGAESGSSSFMCSHETSAVAEDESDANNMDDSLSDASADEQSASDWRAPVFNRAADSPLKLLCHQMEKLLTQGSLPRTLRPDSGTAESSEPMAALKPKSAFVGFSGETPRAPYAQMRLVYDRVNGTAESSLATDTPAIAAKTEELPSLAFESRFESGNLHRAFRVGDDEYDLVLSADWNSQRHQRWFHFAVTNMQKGHTYKLNLVNFSHSRLIANEGCKPVMFSAEEWRQRARGWHRIDELRELTYLSNSFNCNKAKRFTHVQFEAPAFDREATAAETEEGIGSGVVPVKDCGTVEEHFIDDKRLTVDSVIGTVAVDKSADGTDSIGKLLSPPTAALPFDACATEVTTRRRKREMGTELGLRFLKGGAFTKPKQYKKKRKKKKRKKKKGAKKEESGGDEGVVGGKEAKRKGKARDGVAFMGTDTHKTLTFWLRFPHSADTCHIAWFYPFTYSDSQRWLRHLELKQSPATAPCILQRQLLCRTKCGNRVDLLTITDWNSGGSSPVSERPVVVLSARIHPGEANSSWTLKGAVDYLLGTDGTTEDGRVAAALRKVFVFKCIPFLNADGVAHGCHRCSLSGVDLNRQFLAAEVSRTPTIFHLKRMFRLLEAQKRVVFAVVDFHGHSIIRNFELYGCGPNIDGVLFCEKKARFDAVDSVLKRYAAIRHSDYFLKSQTATECSAIADGSGECVLRFKLLPMLISLRANDSLSYAQCTWNIAQKLVATSRAVLWKDFGIQHVFTLETSYMGAALSTAKAAVHYDTRDYARIGTHICAAFYDMFFSRDAVRDALQRIHAHDSDTTKHSLAQSKSASVTRPKAIVAKKPKAKTKRKKAKMKKTRGCDWNVEIFVKEP